MKLIRKNKKKGFTLVELIVVIAILAILALILIPAITGYVGKAEDSTLASSARAIHSQAVMHVAENGFGETELQNELSKGNDDVEISVASNEEQETYTITVTLKGKDKAVTVDQDGNIKKVDKVDKGL